MSLADTFPAITTCNEPLAPHTHLRIGGPAEYYIQPHSVKELASVLQYCKRHSVPLRMLGGGHNLLVRDDPVPGAVVRLTSPEFTFMTAEGNTIRAGGGAGLMDLIACAVRNGLSGLETLVGIRGAVGGSVRCNVGDRSGEIASSVRQVALMTDDGQEEIRSREELVFGEHSSDLDEPVILWVDFHLESELPEVLLKRMRKTWILRKAAEPFTHQPSVRMFRDPRGQSAANLIGQAGLSNYRSGGAEVSDRNNNYVIAHPGTTASDILALLDHVRSRVQSTCGVGLDQELHVW